MKKVFVMGYQELAGIVYLVAMRDQKIVRLATLNSVKDLVDLSELTEERLVRISEMVADLSVSPTTT